MQWSGAANGGFTTAAASPWLPVNPDYATLNVEAQLKKDLGLNSHAAIYSFLVGCRYLKYLSRLIS
jgi:hypothetical protein